MYLMNGNATKDGNNTRYNLNNETRRERMKEPSTRSEPCQAEINGKNCGETETLAILNEFRKLYEDKLMEIDRSGDANASELKVNVLREWVLDLSEQNTMLVQAVEELEQEAAHRVELLEDKIRESCQTTYKAMSATNDVQTLASDVQNLLEVIRRARENGVWNAEGLTFYHVNCMDIFGVPCSAGVCQPLNTKSSHRIIKISSNVSDVILKSKLEKSEKDVVNLQSELHSTQVQLKQHYCENEELKTEICKMNQSARDMRDALTAEVADKYDSLRALRRQYQFLEEQCCQLDKQAHFKDDIIKEMRKELRALKNKEETTLVPLPPQRLVTDLAQYRNKLLMARQTLESMKEQIDNRYGCACRKEQEIGQLEETLMCLLQSIQGTCDELENLEGVHCHDDKMDLRMNQARERIVQLESDFHTTGNVSSLHEMLEEVKVSDMIIRIKEKNIMNQDQFYGKVKSLLKRTKKELETLRKQAETYLVEKKEIEARALKAETKIDQMKNELIEVYESFKFDGDSNNGNTLNTLRETNEYLQSELNHLNNPAPTDGNVDCRINNQEQVISNLKQVVNYQQNTIDELERQYNESNVTNEKLNENITMLESNNWEMEKEIFKLLQDEFVLEKQLESLTQHYNSAWIYYHSKYSDMNKTIDFYLNQSLKLECHLMKSETQRLQLYNEMIEKNTTIDALSQHVIENLKYEETDLILGDLKAKACRCKTLKEHIKKQQREIDELTEKIAILNQVFEEKLQLAFSLQEANNQILNLTNLIAAQNDYIDELKNQISAKDEEIQQLNDALSRSILENEALQKELECSLCCKAELNSRLNETIQENQQLKCALEGQQKKYDSLKDDMHRKEIEITELICQSKCVESLEKELADLKSYASELEEKIKMCRCNELAQENQILLRDIEQLKFELLSTQYDKNMFDKIIQELEDDMKETRCVIEVLHNILETDLDVEELKKENLLLSAELLQRDHDMEALKSEILCLQHQNSHFEKMIELHLQRNDELRLLLSEKQLEVNSLNDLLSNGKCTQECYERTISDLKKDLDNQQNKIETLTQNEKSLKDDLDRTQKQLVSYQTMRLQEENDYQQLQANLNEKNNEINQMQDEIQRVNDQLLALQQENCQLHAEILRLEENHDKTSRMLTDENSQREDLFRKLHEAISKIEMLEKRLDEENSQRDEMIRQVQDSKAKIFSLECLLSDNEMQLEESNRKLDEANLKLCELQTEISRFEDIKTRLSERNKSLNETLQAYDRNLRELSQNQKELLHKMDLLNEDVEEKNCQIENYKKMIEELIDKNNSEHEKDLNRYNQEINERNEIIKKLSLNKDKLDKDYNNLLEQLQALGDQIEKLEGDLYEKESQFEIFKSEKETESKCMQHTMNNLEQQNRDQQRLINRFQLTIAGNEQEINDLREQINQRDKRLDELSTSHEQQINQLDLIHREELRGLHTQINDQANRLNNLKQQFEIKSRDFSRVEQELNQTIDQLQCQENAMVELKKMYEQQIENTESHYRGLNLSLEQKIADKDQEINGLRSAVEKNLRQSNSNSNEINDLYQSLNDKEKCINELRRQNEENMKIFQETQCEQYAQYQQQLNDLMTKIETLNEKIYQCQQENNCLIKSINELTQQIASKDNALSEMSQFCNNESQENDFKLSAMQNKLTNVERTLQQYKQALNEANVKMKMNDIAIGELKSDLEEKNQEIFQLENHIKNLECGSVLGKVSVDKEEIDRCKRNMAEKDRTIRDLKILLEKMNQSITNATEEVQNLSENLIMKERVIGDLRDQLESSVNDTRTRLDEEIERLKMQIQCDNHAIDQLHRLIEQQKLELATKEKEVDDLVARLNKNVATNRDHQVEERVTEYIQDNERLCQQLTQSNEVLITLKAEWDRCEAQLKLAETELQKAESAKENLDNKYQAMLNQQKAEFCHLKSEYERQYEKKLNEVKLALQEMKVQNELIKIEANNEIKETSTKLAQKEAEIQQLNDLIDQIKTDSGNQTNRYQNEWQRATINAFMLESDLTNLRSVVEKQENHLKQIQAEEKQLDDEKQARIKQYEENIKNLCKQLNEKSNQINQMENQFTNALIDSERELKTALEMIRDKDKMIEEKHNEGLEIESLKVKIEILESQCEKLQTKNGLLESQKVVFEANLKEIQVAHEKLQHNLEMVEKNLNYTQEMLNEKDLEIVKIKEKFENDLEGARRKYDHEKQVWKIDMENKNQTIQDLKAFVETMQHQRDRSRELNEMQQELIESQQKVGTLKNSNEKLLIELKKLESENLSLTEEINENINKIKHYQKNIDENHKYIEQLEIESEKLKISNDQMSSTLRCAQLELEKIRTDINNERKDFKDKYDWLIKQSELRHKSDMSKLERQIKAQDDVIVDLNRTIEKLQVKQTTRNNELEIMFEAMEKLREELKNRDEELEIIKSIETHSQSKIKHLESINSELKAFSDKSNKSIASLKSELEDRQFERLKAENLQAQVEQLKVEINKKDQEIIELRQNQTQFIDQMESRCEQELENYRIEIKENLKTSLDQIRVEHEEKCKETDRLNEQLQQIRSKCVCGAIDGVSKLVELNSFIDNLKDQLRDKEKVIKYLKTNHTWECQLGDKLQSELEKMLQSKDEEIEGLHQWNKKITEQLYVTQNHISCLNRDLDRLKRMQSSTNNENDRSHDNNIYKDEIDSLRRATREMRHELELKKEDNDRLSTMLQRVTKNRDQLRNESKKVLSNTRLWLLEQNNINESLSESIEEKNLVLNQLKDENKNLLIEIAHLRRQFQMPRENFIEIPLSDGVD